MTGAAGQPADGDARRIAFVTGGAGGIGTAS
jgi:2-hydroxycyclohexanecarboxyl-CoA dehydrogenase